MSAQPRFSKKTLEFLKRASRQKRPDWLEKSREDYEKHLLLPLRNLAAYLKAELAPLAPQYHFPQKGIGRIKRSATRAKEYGALYKDWVSYAAAKPRKSRFEHNPNLFFLIQLDDPEGDDVLVAGGLYMPSSKQLRAIREAIARNASAFDELFSDRAFSVSFPGGFSSEKISSRPPRGFDPQHPRMDWLRLQAFFVWRPYKKSEFYSADFPGRVASDCKQILRLNALLEKALLGRLPASVASDRTKQSRLDRRLLELEAPRHKMDF